ncbi:hypothetical protein BC938DRAFT_476283 [Jimgerdemannia flammicorona]|uniref:Type I restriction enzyme R protein N-terminal domain-containing protein n=1 Tax=Jimgerdemannia flammicorona TaxID=994334 RepID=A0A433PIJ7_9FUNG|nr:hypothetical protein BC938DRAFT_476283 [Jimgerdemannia flammicorona]
MVKGTGLNGKEEHVLDLTVRIEGKKAYGEWSVKDVLHELLLGQHKSIDAIPELDIDNTFGIYNLDQQQESFLKEILRRIAKAFHYAVNSNEATARNYINPIMVEAVSAVQETHALVRLAVEEQSDGSKGYGRFDYVILCEELAVVVTEAKMVEVQNGIAQNIAQLHTAVEMYGIVTTGNEWRFLSWKIPTTNNSKPTVLLSTPYNCSFKDMGGVSEVLSAIIRILQSQAGDVAGQSAEEVESETDERGSQRARLE